MTTTAPSPTGAGHGTADAAVPARMRAVVQRAFGTSDVLHVETVPRPSPGPEEVLIEVHAAGLDRGTWHLVAGLPYLVRLAGYGIRTPKNPIPGLDVAGTVVDTGTQVSGLVPGDRVFGVAKGSFAEYAVASADKLAHVPSNLSDEQAAVVPISGITALEAVVDHGRVEAGQHVLVLGASGGVGSFAVQIAAAAGAHVTGVAGTRNLDLVRSLGAEHVVDYTAEDVTGTSDRYDLIVDTGGRHPVRRLRRILQPRGTLVIVGGEGGNRLTGGFGRQFRALALSPFVKQRLTMFLASESSSQLERLAAMLESGAVVPAIRARFPLEQAAAAVDAMDEGRTSAKTVIVVRAAGRAADDMAPSVAR